MRTTYPQTNISPDHWLRKFYNYFLNQDFSPATVRGYFYDLNHFRTWLMELNDQRPPLENISTVDVLYA
jgi:site-specific recombinase XerD